MGIYISGVKGLPEQVQQNKEDIKTIQEEIEGIDFEAIRELEEQVAENTQDINNLEASIGVQNQAINTLNNDVDALESKTQKITYDEDTGKTTIDSYTIINGDLDTDNVAVAGNGTFQNANGSGLHFQEGVNDDEVVLTNKESGTAHYLTLHADGTLTLDGNPVGGGTELYQHNITILLQGGALVIYFSITNSSPTALTRANVLTYLSNFTNTELGVSGYVDESGSKYAIIYIYYFSATSLNIGYINNGSVGATSKNISNSTVVDKVIQVA